MRRTSRMRQNSKRVGLQLGEPGDELQPLGESPLVYGCTLTMSAYFSRSGTAWNIALRNGGCGQLPVLDPVSLSSMKRACESTPRTPETTSLNMRAYAAGFGSESFHPDFMYGSFQMSHIVTGTLGTSGFSAQKVPSEP